MEEKAMHDTETRIPISIFRRGSSLVLICAIALASICLACSSEGDGISNFFFASPDNPARVTITLAVATNISLSGTSPLRLAVYTNINNGPGVILTNHSFSSTNLLSLTLTNVVSTPIYILAWHDLDNNSTLDTLEPFVTYQNALTLTNLTPAKVYGGTTTNSFAMGITKNILYNTATLKVSASYTGALTAQITNNLAIAVFSSTNFSSSLITNLWFAQSKSRTFIVSGLTNAKVWLAGWFDSNGDNNFDSGSEYCGVYANGNSTATATSIAFITNITSEKSVSLSFGDSYKRID